MASFLSSDVRRKYTVNERTYHSFVYGSNNTVTLSKIESIYAGIIDRSTGHCIVYAYKDNALTIKDDLVFKMKTDYRADAVLMETFNQQ